MRVLLFLPLLWAAGCQQLLCLNAGKPYPGETGGATGTATTATGGAPCTVPEECAGEDGECGHRTCDGGVCGYFAEAPLTPCSNSGVCDGSGNCAIGDFVMASVFGDMAAQQAQAVAIDSQDAVLFGGDYFGSIQINTDLLMNDGVFIGKLDAGFVPQWGRGSEGTPGASLYGLAVLPGDSVAATGRFTDTLDFDTPILANDNMAGSGDVFALELDTMGAYQWSEGYGDTLDQSGEAIGVDPDGNLVIAGFFEGDLSFGGTPLASGGDKDPFVATVAPGGKGVWSFSTGDGGYQRALDVATHPDGSIVVVGQLFGSASFENNTLTSKQGSSDFFVVKWEAGHMFAWAKAFGGSGGDYATAVAIDAQGNVSVAGVCDGTLDFGGPPLSRTTAGVCVAKLTSAGEHVWSKTFGGPLNEQARGLAADRAGNVIMVGYFDATIDFVDPPYTAPNDEAAVFVVKLSATTGAPLWSHAYGGGSAYGVAVDSEDNVVVVGSASSSAGTIQFDDPQTINGGSDAFVLKLSP